MANRRRQTWIGLIVAGVVLIPAAFAGLWWYMIATAVPLYTTADEVPSATALAPPQKWSDTVDRARQIVRAGLIAQNLPALSVAVGIDGDIVWAEGFGFADLEQRVPVAPGMSFRIGTASTVLTSVAAGLLLEKGALKLDDEIQRYVPAFPDKPSPVTLRQVMGHVAGIRTDSGDEGPLFSAHCERPVDALQYFADRSLLFEPGAEYRYSSYGWILVSAAIEAAAQQPFLTFMREQVFEPLGMHDTRPDSATESVPRRATPYFPRYGADPRYGRHLMRPLDHSCYAGASVFLSTPSDLVRFAIAINGGRLLKPATVQLLQTSQRLTSGEETGYGLGWDLESAALNGRQTRVVGHDGDVLGGMVASLVTVPGHPAAVAVMSNISYADTAGVALRVAEAFTAEESSP